MAVSHSPEEEAVDSVQSGERDPEVCGGLGSGGWAMRVYRGGRPPGPMMVAATVLLLLNSVGLARGSEDIVVGCGGFVKSDVEINYSLIEVSAHLAAQAGAPCVTLSQLLSLPGSRWSFLLHQAVATSPTFWQPSPFKGAACRGPSTPTSPDSLEWRYFLPWGQQCSRDGGRTYVRRGVRDICGDGCA